jgi:hypothetical protein
MNRIFFLVSTSMKGDTIFQRPEKSAGASSLRRGLG